jgi:hypothetical protein
MTPNKVVAIIPVNIMPITFSDSEPAPEAVTNGITPNIKAKDVIRMGLNVILPGNGRIQQACPLPFSSSKLDDQYGVFCVNRSA